MNDKISDKDRKDWENFVNGSEKLEIKDIINSPKNFKNEKTIDLQMSVIKTTMRLVLTHNQLKSLKILQTIEEH